MSQRKGIWLMRVVCSKCGEEIPDEAKDDEAGRRQESGGALRVVMVRFVKVVEDAGGLVEEPAVDRVLNEGEDEPAEDEGDQAAEPERMRALA